MGSLPGGQGWTRSGVRNQNSRLVQDDGNAGGRPVPPHLEQISRGCVQGVFEHLQGRRIQTHSGHPGMAGRLQGREQSCVPHLEMLPGGLGQGLGRAGAGAAPPACPTPCDSGWQLAWIPGAGTTSGKVQTGTEQNPTALLCHRMSPVSAGQVTLEV